MNTNPITIIYKDLSGVVTSREITECKLGWKRDRLECYCLSAKDNRSFFINSIQKFYSKEFSNDLTKFVQTLPLENPPSHEINEDGEVNYSFTPEIEFGEKRKSEIYWFSKIHKRRIRNHS